MRLKEWKRKQEVLRTPGIDKGREFGTGLMGSRVLWADQGERAGSRQCRLLGNLTAGRVDAGGFEMVWVKRGIRCSGIYTACE